MESQEHEERGDESGGETTTPEERTHEAATPPGSGDVDDEAIDEAQERLDQAGGGH